MFSYLAIEGGIAGEPMFGSLAVNARAGLGSPYPRPLQAGDEIAAQTARRAPSARIELPAPPDLPIRVVLGPQDDEFGDDGRDRSSPANGQMSATSDRMGYRLEGPRFAICTATTSSPTAPSTAASRFPAIGQPIVLMPDRGTSGGYPKIATVISADLGRLAQSQPGTRLPLQGDQHGRGAGRIPGDARN